MKKTLTLTLDVPDAFDSFSSLESFIQQVGRQFQRDLCSDLVSEQVEAVGDTTCPSCGSSETTSKGSALRHLKTLFGEIAVRSPRWVCRSCGHSFFW